MLDDVSALKGLFTGNLNYFSAIIKAQFAFIYWLFFFHRKKKNLLKKIKIKYLTGVYHHNIVFEYFIKKKKTFEQIVKKS